MYCRATRCFFSSGRLRIPSGLRRHSLLRLVVVAVVGVAAVVFDAVVVAAVVVVANAAYSASARSIFGEVKASTGAFTAGEVYFAVEYIVLGD